MSRQEIYKTIINHLSELKAERISLFGSFARNETTDASDIDILVKFSDTFSLLQLVEIEDDLSDKLGIRVDLITEGAIRNKTILSSINADMEIIYQA